MRSRRFLQATVAIGVAVLLVGACSRNETDSEEVRDVVAETSKLSHRFVYREVTPAGVETVVQGIVEDDFRYKAQLSVDGEPVAERVVSDDAVAVRFFDADYVTGAVDKRVVSEVDRSTDLDGIDVFEVLQSGRWLLDERGAPPQIRNADDAVDRGVDPISDALDVVARARDLTFLNVTGFKRYSEDTISPTYRTDEDPFPRPEKGSGVDRYDLAQPDFVRSEDVRNIALPGEAQFRKFSVYVEDGRVIRIAEEVGVTDSVLADFETFMRRLLATSAPADVAERFNATLDGLTGQEKAQFLLESLNTFRDLQGDPPVRFRSLVYELSDLGHAVDVSLPTSDVVRGNLAVLVNLGKKPVVPTAGSPAGPEDAEADVPDGVTVG